MSLSSPIIKVNKIIGKDKIESIVVFWGTNLEIPNPTTLFNEFIESGANSEDPKFESIKGLFSPDELTNISTNRIPVTFTNQSIHIDDNIGTIKLKIFEAIGKNVGLEEIYLFCLRSEKLNPITFYQNLTQNDRVPLTRVRLDQMIYNIYSEDGKPIDFGLPEKEKYSYDDILQLNLLDRDYLVARALGQKFVFSSEYPFISDPFYVSEYDHLLERSRKELTSLNNNLLLENEVIHDNTLYLCLAEDVFKEMETKAEYASKIYFPFLFKAGIDTVDKLEAKREQLVQNTTTILSKNVERLFENIDMFYDVYKYKQPSKIFSQVASKTGINNFKIVIHPDSKIKIPMDVVFKILHATFDYPLIKYNPETRQENIYRLYTDKISTDGRKIPYLNKSSIMKLSKTIGRRRSVAVYTKVFYQVDDTYETEKDENDYYIICEFDDTGSISVYSFKSFVKPVLLGETKETKFTNINKIIDLSVNQLLEQIKPFFEQSGLYIPLFKSVAQDNIEIRDITYQMVYSIKKPINLKQYSGCLSSAFVVESTNLTELHVKNKDKGAYLRFKRVSNFTLLDSQTAFIIEKIDHGFNQTDILFELQQNYDIDEEKARDILQNTLRDLEATRGVNKKRSIMIKKNPGFKTVMSLDPVTSEISIVVSDLKDLYYLDTFPVYIDTFIRITQDQKSTSINKKTITELCSGGEIDDLNFDDEIVAQSEKSLNEKNQVPDIYEESPVYSESISIDSGDENENELLRMLGLEGEDIEVDEIGEDLGGGGPEGSSDDEVKSDTPPPPEPGPVSPSSSEKEEEVKSDTPPPSSESSEEEVKSDTPPPKEEEVKSDTPPSESSALAMPLEEVKSDTPPPSSEKEEEKEEIIIPPLDSLSSSEEKEAKSDTPPPPALSLEEEIVNKPPIKIGEVIKQPEIEFEKEEKEEEIALDAIPEEVEELEIAVAKPKRKGKAAKVNPETRIPIEKSALEKAKPSIADKVIENKVQDITGMKLRFPNPFSKKIEDKMPQLFVKSKDDKMDLYTRMCRMNLQARRHPVILTKTEKDKLVEEHPDHYLNDKGQVKESEFIEYGANPKDPSKKYFFTCPRYWCLLTNTMVTKQDILDGKCGPKVANVEDAIIPQKDSKVPKGKYVYQFYGEDEEVYPGFHKEKLTDGTCIPCCYNNWNTPEMKNRRDTCQGSNNPKMDVSASEKAIEDEIENDLKEIEGYVKGPEKYPLGEHRWGYMPIIVQKFLHEVNADCQVSKTNMNLKPDHTCLLRHGVERSPKQSFIACIATTMFFGQTYMAPDPDKPGKNKSVPLVKKFIPNAKTEVPTIEQMKQLIIDATDLDRFITYQNGDLVTSFANPELNMEKQVPDERIRKAKGDMDESNNNFVKGEQVECNFRGLDKWYKGTIVNSNRNGTYDVSFNKIKANLNEYKGSELYKKITSKKGDRSELYKIKPSREADESPSSNSNSSADNEFDLAFFEKAVEAFENFKRFLIDKTVYIDYTYLWDLLCIPNPKLFEGRGINLVVLEMPEDDTTNNIDLACPSNHYSSHIYDVRKSSLILLKRENWFEPIYAFHNSSKPKVITTFTEYNRQLPSSLRAVFSKIIRPTLGEKCMALQFPSQPREYRFETAPLLDVLIKKLIDRKYKINDQVLNFQGKVIGLTVTSPTNKTGFVPCFPSSLTQLKRTGKNTEYGYVFMTDNIWNTYDDTLAFLKEYYKYDDIPKGKTKDKTKDKTSNTVLFKVTDDDMDDTLVIGFLTKTNQFIQISDPKPISQISDEIPSISGNNTLTADINTLASSKVDNRRVDFIKRIQLETIFYNVFRNTIRILFNDYSNSDKRKEIQTECNEQTTLYNAKLTKVVELLKALVSNNVEFVDHFNYKSINEDDIQSCIANKSDNCVDNATSICKISKTADKCIVAFPANNLVTKMPNEEYYYGRMADELIRYNRIKSFIFKPQAYLSFGQIKYNLRDNEIIVLEDMLTQEFFDSMVPSDINIYAKYNTYDNAEPIITQRYNSDVKIDEIINPHQNKDCQGSEPDKISSGYWKNCFPKTYREITYKGSHLCALYLIIDLVQKFKGNSITIEDIKSDLVDEYKRLVTKQDDENEGELIIDMDRNQKIIDFLNDEGQYDVKQLVSRAMTFEQMIFQDGFTPVNFDLWILLNKYQIPSIMISNSPLPETNRQRTEFVCYNSDDGLYAFIIVPAMYSRQGKKTPEYKYIVNENGSEKIAISEIPMTDNQCLVSIEESINNEDYNYTIEEFFDENIFKKKAYKKHVDRPKVGESESESESISNKPNVEMEAIKAARKEGLAAVSAVADISTLKEEAPIQRPKKSVTKKVTAKKGGKNSRRRR
jgi:hypothetical protein